jgi:hypothetical protein
MRRRAIRFMIYLVVTIAAIMLEVFAGVKYGVNGWLVCALMAGSLLPLIWFAISPHITPGWVRQVLVNGARASADVLKDDPMDGMGYRGDDMWIDLPVEVHPENDEPFKAQMKIRLSQAVFGLMAHGKRVSVRYDPKDKSRVVLDGQLVKLPGKRVEA